MQPDEMTVTVPLTQGHETIIDAADLAFVSQYRWFLAKRPKGTHYARTAFCVDGKGKQIKVSLHRMLLNAPPDKFVDHINGNGLDNRRANLRLATHEQSNRSRRKENGRGGRPSTSKYKGVRKTKKGRGWEANARGKYLGYFATELGAARAYDAEALRVFGEFAVLNFPVGLDEEEMRCAMNSRKSSPPANASPASWSST